MKEQDLNRLLEQEIPDETTDLAEQKFQRKVRRAMNRSLYSRILLALLVVALLGTGIYFGISAAMNGIFYHPGKETSFMTETDNNGRSFAFLLEETIHMNYPGVRCRVVSGDDGDYYRAKGFGTYDVDVSLTDTFDYVTLPAPPTHTFHIGMSKMTGPAKLETGYAPLVRRVDEFIAPDSDHAGLEQFTPKAVKEELEKLPASAYLDVSVSFSSDLTADEVAQLMHNYSGVQFQWLALKGQEQTLIHGIAGGMSLYSIFGDAFDDKAAERYPGYFLPNPSEITGADLEQCLRSRLQLLIDHPDFVKTINSNFEYMISQTLLEKRLENAQKEWACYGMRLEIGQQDLERLMEQLPITQIVVNDVKVSRFQK